MIKHTATLYKDISGLGVTISPADNVPLHQVYDQETSSYIPDHSIIPLILVPEVCHEGADVSAEYTERAWYLVSDTGAETQITAATPGHQLYPTGYPLGLKITENLPAEQDRRYVFRVKARGVRGSDAITLRTNKAASAAPSLEIDAPAQLPWDPFDTSHDLLTITPAVHARGKTCTVRWRRIDAGARRAIDYTDPEDCELSLNAATNALTIDRRLMGDKACLVCELLVAGVIVDEKTVTLVRRIPELKQRLIANTYFSDTDSVYHARLEVEKVPSGIIADPSAELLIDWYDGTRHVGIGNTHDYPLSKDTTRVEAGADVHDRGPWKRLVDSGGLQIVDSSGKIIIAR